MTCANDRFSEEEQDLIDRIVNCATSNAAITEDQVDRLLIAWGGDISNKTDWLSEGIYLELIKGELSDDKLSGYEGLDLGSIDDTARIRFAREMLVRACEDYDADVVPGFRSGMITSRNGNEALIVFAVRGYSFSGISEDFYGAFASEAAFREHAKNDDFFLTDEILSSANTQKWVSDAQLLVAWQRT